MKTFYQLTDCDDGAGGAGAWIPTESYVDLILEGIVQYGDLSGKVCVIGTDLAAGNGDTVNIRYVTPRTHSCVSFGCGNCVSSTSTTFGDYTIDVKQWADYDKIQNFADWQAKGDIIGQVANEMSKRLAHCRDSRLWTALCDATPNAWYATGSAWSATRAIETSCCSFSFDIYNCIIDARTHLKGDGYNPDYVLIHPYAAAYLYYKEGRVGHLQDNFPMIKIGADGYLASIAGLKVIEVKVAVDDDNDPSTASDELAFVIDSSRALGEAWGKRPDFNEFYDGKCNATDLTVWSYWGCDSVDDNAIVAIVGP